MTFEWETIKEGSKGQYVSFWQRLIQTKADGIFGPVTDEVTRIAQAMLGVPVDGIVGPVTMRAALPQ